MRKSLFLIWTALILILNASVVFAESYDAQISSISKNITEKINASGKKSAAVVDFTDLQGNVSELGRFVAEELSADLQNKATKFQVVDRTLFKGALKARQFSLPAILDPAAIKKIGQTAEIDVLIIGVITPLGDIIRISCKIITTDTARVIGSARGDVNKTKAIDTLMTNKMEPGAKVAEESTEKPAAGVVPKVAPVPPVPSVQPAQPAQAAQAVKPVPAITQTVSKTQVEHFTFEVKECRQSGQQVVCTITAANSLKKQKRLARCTSILTDNKGRQYNSTGYATFGEERSSPWADIHPGESRQMAHTFENVDPEAKYADILLECAYIDGKAAFTKINLTK